MRTGPRGQPPGLEVVAVNKQRKRRVDVPRLRRVLRGAADALAVRGEVALVLAGDRALHALNQRYRGKDKPTDVLTFPGPCGEHVGGPKASRRGECAACVGQAPSLGDIVISLDTAARNARERKRTLPEELDVLALHGFLHVLGYDHETDDGTMDRLERRLRRRLLGHA
jgi:probable rRNA maturation factor